MLTSKVKKNYIHLFHTPEAMRRWGHQFGQRLEGGDFIALVGDLGAGKTTLVQGIAEGWGYHRRANSPTFALVNEYESGRGHLLHMDMYRLSKKELDAFPLEDYLNSDSVCLMEWADRMRNRWPADALELRFTAPAPKSRQVEIVAPSKTWLQRLTAL